MGKKNSLQRGHPCRVVWQTAPLTTVLTWCWHDRRSLFTIVNPKVVYLAFLFPILNRYEVGEIHFFSDSLVSKKLWWSSTKVVWKGITDKDLEFKICIKYKMGIGNFLCVFFLRETENTFSKFSCQSIRGWNFSLFIKLDAMDTRNNKINISFVISNKKGITFGKK